MGSVRAAEGCRGDAAAGGPGGVEVEGVRGSRPGKFGGGTRRTRRERRERVREGEGSTDTFCLLNHIPRSRAVR